MFKKLRLCLTDLIALYNQMTSSVNESREADVVYCEFVKASDHCQTREVWPG